jgi:hypothetical protein
MQLHSKPPKGGHYWFPEWLVLSDEVKLVGSFPASDSNVVSDELLPLFAV